MAALAVRLPPPHGAVQRDNMVHCTNSSANSCTFAIGSDAGTRSPQRLRRYHQPRGARRPLRRHRLNWCRAKKKIDELRETRVYAGGSE
jgi:hypothetical protein